MVCSPAGVLWSYHRTRPLFQLRDHGRYGVKTGVVATVAVTQSLCLLFTQPHLDMGASSRVRQMQRCLQLLQGGKCHGATSRGGSSSDTKNPANRRGHVLQLVVCIEAVQKLWKPSVEPGKSSNHTDCFRTQTDQPPKAEQQFKPFHMEGSPSKDDHTCLMYQVRTLGEP